MGRKLAFQFHQNSISFLLFLFILNVFSQTTRIFFSLISSNKNLIDNGEFNSYSLTDIPSWSGIGDGYMPDLPNRNATASTKYPINSIFLISPKISEKTRSIQGVTQTITKAFPLGNSIHVSAWSKTYELAGMMNDNFGVYLDIYFQDGGYLYSQSLPFPTGTNDWNFRDKTIWIGENRVIKSITVNVIIREHTGVCWFDDISLTVKNTSNFMGIPQPSCTVSAFGSLHYLSSPSSSSTPSSFPPFSIRSLHPDEHYPFFSSPSIQIYGNSALLSSQSSPNAPLLYSISWSVDNNNCISPISLHYSLSPYLFTSFSPISPSFFSTDTLGFNVTNGTWDSSIFGDPKLYVNSQERLNFLNTPTFTSNAANFTVTPFYYNSLSTIPYIHAYSIHYYHSKIHMEIVVHFLYSDSLNSSQCKFAGYLEFVGELNNTCLDSYTRQMVDYQLTRGNTTNEDEYCRANAFCEKQALTGLKEECISDLLSLNNEYIIQNYHSMESKLNFTMEKLITTSTSMRPCTINEYHEQEEEDSFNYAYVFPILIFVVFIALAVFIRIRKKKAKNNAVKKQSIEMTELTSDHDVIVDEEL